MTPVAVPEVAVPAGGASRRPAPRSQGVALCAGMLRGALLGANLALLSALGIGLATAGGPGLLNAAVGGGLALVFFATGQGVQLIATQLADGTGLALLLTSFLLRAGAMGLLLWYAMGHASSLEPHFVRGAFFCGAILVTTGWVAGVLATGRRQQVFAYDSDYQSSLERGDSV